MNNAELAQEANKQALQLLESVFEGSDCPSADMNGDFVWNLYADAPIYYQAWRTWVLCRKLDDILSTTDADSGYSAGVAAERERVSIARAQIENRKHRLEQDYYGCESMQALQNADAKAWTKGGIDTLKFILDLLDQEAKL